MVKDNNFKKSIQNKSTGFLINIPANAASAYIIAF